MNRGLIKSISVGSKIYEDVSIEGYDIPMLLFSTSGVYICLSGDEVETVDVELFEKVKQYFGTINSNCFLFKFADDATGYLYSGLHDGFTYYRDIYEAYEACNDFATLYLSNGANKHIEGLLTAICA